MFGLRYTPEEDAFRADAARVARGAPPAHARRPTTSPTRRDFQRAWQRELAGGGWVGIQWPREHGGRGASLKEQIIFTEEMARARAPEILDAVAVNIVGSVLIHAGTPEQQRRYLPRILPADDVWCLGFSEPNAGSDLASLRCRAERDGDHWVVSGQKVWSSKAHFADWLLLLVRTDPVAPRHRGISCLIVDMHAPGVTWRPLVQISGRREFNEVFLEEVRVPVEQTVGPVNGGWPLIRAALAHERGTLWAFDFKIRLQNGALALADLYRTVRDGGAGRGDGSRARCATRSRRRGSSRRSSARTRCGSCRSCTRARTRAPTRRSRSSSAARSSSAPASCRCGSKAPTRSSASASRARIDRGEWQERYLYSRSVTISSGTSEVLRSLVAQQALGLPRA